MTVQFNRVIHDDIKWIRQQIPQQRFDTKLRQFAQNAINDKFLDQPDTCVKQISLYRQGIFQLLLELPLQSVDTLVRRRSRIIDDPTEMTNFFMLVKRVLLFKEYVNKNDISKVVGELKSILYYSCVQKSIEILLENTTLEDQFAIHRTLSQDNEAEENTELRDLTNELYNSLNKCAQTKRRTSQEQVYEV